MKNFHTVSDIITISSNNLLFPLQVLFATRKTELDTLYNNKFCMRVESRETQELRSYEIRQ